MESVPDLRRGIPVRQPIRGVGKPDPAGMTNTTTNYISDMIMSDASSRVAMTAEQYKDMPPWAVSLAGEIRSLRIELTASNLALTRRGLITEPELREARNVIIAETSKVFQQMVDKMGRQFAQQPTAATDPRTAPREQTS